MAVRIEKNGKVWTVIHDRPEARNAMDPESADRLTAAFLEFDADKDAAVAVFYVDDAQSARDLLDAHQADVTKPPAVWFAYPKANRTDINRDTLWPIVVEYGLRPNGQIALDEVWSALRFRANKPGEEAFTGGKK